MTDPMRVLFVSHDRRGLGHIRRTLALAHVMLDRVPDCAVLVVTGSRMVHAFPSRSRLDYVTLPRLAPDTLGSASTVLNVPRREIQTMREKLILQVTRLFRPSVLLLGSPPLQENSEVGPAIAYLRKNMVETAVVLSLRDIPDDPAHVAALWHEGSICDEWSDDYDRVLIHGSRDIFDVPSEYAFSEQLAAKTRFCGYIPRPITAEGDNIRRRFCPPGSKLLVLTVGGGGDGSALIRRSLAAVCSSQDSGRIVTLAILGPEMPSSDSSALRATYGQTGHVCFLDFVDSALDYFAAADLIITMGGYNTLSEVSALRRSAIVVPRALGSSEQLVRARRFAQRGLVEVLHPDDATTTTLAAMVWRHLNGPPSPRQELDFDDGSTFARMIKEVVASKKAGVVQR